MVKNGIEGIYLETHSRTSMTDFLRELGFAIDFADDESAMLRNDDGPYDFVQQVPDAQPLTVELVLHVPDAAQCDPGDAVEVIRDFEQTHWGAWEMQIRDPDGRTWNLHAPEHG